MKQTIIALLCLLLAVAVHAQPNFAPGQVLFKMNQQVRTNSESLNAVLSEFGVVSMEKVLPSSSHSQLYKVCMADTSSARARELVRRLNDLPEVESAAPNVLLHFNLQPSVASPVVGEASKLCGAVGIGTLGSVPYYGKQIVNRKSVNRKSKRKSPGFYDDSPFTYYYDGETLVEDPTTNPLYAEQWGLSALRIEELWNKPVINRRRPVVAIIDTGVDIDHPDLKDNILMDLGWYSESNTSFDDVFGHGTHIAGIIAGEDNDIGIIGANPHALIVPVKALMDDGNGYCDEIIAGIDYAVSIGADIIVMAFGGPAGNIESSDDYIREMEELLHETIRNASQKCILVTSAGDYVKMDSPGISPYALTVGAYDWDGTPAYFTPIDTDGVLCGDSPGFNNHTGIGSNVELMAPGVNIVSTWNDGGTNVETGTGQACAFIAGAISALLMVKDYASREELWGEVTHGKDYNEIYNITEHPADLDLLGFQTDIRRELVPGSGNTNIQPNYSCYADIIHTLHLFPMFRTVFGKATNIRVHAELDESVDKSIYRLTTADVDFGYGLDPYENQVGKYPITLEASPDMTENDKIVINFSATCKETDKVMRRSVEIKLTKVDRKKVCDYYGGYAVYTDEDKTLTFYYDNLVKERAGEAFSTELVYDTATEHYFPQWTSLINDKVEHVVFDQSYRDARPKTMDYWFFLCDKLYTIDNLEYLNTSEVESMCATFALCSSMNSIDLSHFDTHNVKDMSSMFWYCTNLYSADLSRFSMNSVTHTDWMFNDCQHLLSIYCNNDWNELTKLESSEGMFTGCERLMGETGTKYNSSAPADITLARPDIAGQPGYFTTKVILQDADVNVDGTVDVADIAAVITVMAGGSISSSRTTDVGAGAKGDLQSPLPARKAEEAPAETYAVFTDYNATLTFYYDNRKSGRAGTVFGTEGVYDIYTERYFPEWTSQIADKLERVVFDYSFSAARPTSMENWFFNCHKLCVFDNIEYLNSSAVESMYATFLYCNALPSFNLSHLDTHSVTDMGSMFQDCHNLYSLDLSRQNLKSVTNINSMFNGCRLLRTIYCNKDWNLLPEKKSSIRMFAGCDMLKGEAGTGYDSEFTDVYYARPDGIDEMHGYFTLKPITGNPDVNADGVVDVADIAYIISVMAGK